MIGRIFTLFTSDVRKELLFFYLETSDFKLDQKCSFHGLKNSSWLEMQSFSLCRHFLKASQNADLGAVIIY